MNMQGGSRAGGGSGARSEAAQARLTQGSDRCAGLWPGYARLLQKENEERKPGRRWKRLKARSCEEPPDAGTGALRRATLGCTRLRWKNEKE